MSFCISKLANQIETILKVDSSAELIDGSLKDIKVSVSDLSCPKCGHMEHLVNNMIEHLLVCSECSPNVVDQYKRYRLVPAKITAIMRQAQEIQQKLLLVPINGLPEQHLRLPVASPMAHLILSGATVSTTPDRNFCYEFSAQAGRKLQLNTSKFLVNQLRMREAENYC